MRFDELVLKIPDGEFRLRVHPRLTVLSGFDAADRAVLCDGLRGVLDGSTDQAMLRYVASNGRVAVASARNGTVSASFEDDRSEALLPSPDTIRDQLVLTAGHLVAASSQARPDDPPELREARESLAQLTAELDAAAEQQREIERLQSEISRVEHQLTAARDGRARREYARTLAELDQVRAEAATLQSGAGGAEADQRLLDSAEETRRLTDRWRQHASALAEVSGRVGKAERLSPDELATAATIPDSAPAELDEALSSLAHALAEREAHQRKLQGLAVAQLPEPTDPAVAELAHLDQSTLWSLRQRVVDSARDLESARVAIGGIELDDRGTPGVVRDLEEAHAAVEAAQSEAEAKQTQGVAITAGGLGLALIGALSALVLTVIGVAIALVGGYMLLFQPRRAVQAAERAERGALEQTGASTYLGFHIRRVEATVDPDRRERADVAAMEHRLAAQSWADLVPDDVSAERAGELEAEVRAYHEALTSLGDTADEMQRLRAELAGRIEPALRVAHNEVIGLCQPYAIDPAVLEGDDARLVARLVQHQVGAGRRARLQAELEEAEAIERKSSAELDEHLLRLGISDGDLEARAEAADWSVARAADRQAARARARPSEEIEADLVRLHAEAARLHRPEWDAVTPDEAMEPDMDALEATRASFVEQLRVTERGSTDVARLADRRAAVERRIAALEARPGDDDAAIELVAELQDRLVTHLGRAAQAGPDGDPLPVVLDDVLVRVPAERKWDLLDLIHRISDQQQLVYICDDAFVSAWARGRPEGELSLLEPVPDEVEV